jgi:DNA-binding CsgD family transcriptional regulator
LADRAARNPDELLAMGALDGRPHSLLLALRWTDRVDVSERLSERWLEIARRQGSAQSFVAAMGNRSNLNRMRGLEAAQETHDSLGLPQQLSLAHPFMGVLDLRVQLHAARGDYARALADFEEMTRRRGGIVNGGMLSAWLTAIECRHRLDQHDVLPDGLDRAFAVATRWGTDTAIGSVLRTRGRLSNDSRRAIEDLQAAVEHLERSPRRLELASALVDLGGALRRAGRRTASREPLRVGHELARECGADGLAELARRELAASGIRVRRERLSGVESLTASERRIVELAASGASNAEIAQSLFVTVKTVEMHLTHAYRKLEISGRSELGRALRAPSRSARAAA